MEQTQRNERLAMLAEPLLAWYDKNKRILPWRENTDPYRVWVSAIMLQRRTFAAACAILLLIPVLTCVVCDLNIAGTLTWARYVLLSFALLYIYLFPPMVLLRHRLLISIPLDCVGTMGFLWGLERLTGGDWFLPFGLPLTVLVFGVLLAVVLLVRKSPWNLLKILAAILCGMGVFVVALEWLINRSFYLGRPMTWAVYTCIPCLLLGAALFVIDRNPACKQELRKRFFV